MRTLDPTTGAKVGDRVRLERHTDPYSDLAPGTEGTVDLLDDAGTVHVRWDTGSHLGMVHDAGDRFTILPARGAAPPPHPTRAPFTTRLYLRSHGRAPSRTTMGSWGFQASRSEMAWDRDLHGPVVWGPPHATLAEAKRHARSAPELAGAAWIAVMP